MSRWIYTYTYKYVDESIWAEDVEIYYDPAEPFGGLLKGSSMKIQQRFPLSKKTCQAGQAAGSYWKTVMQVVKSLLFPTKLLW
ncbi:hypothetical protein AB3S75_023884 [Citrus x aurantiifolia]